MEKQKFFSNIAKCISFEDIFKFEPINY
jgi:hypothetical protein